MRLVAVDSLSDVSCVVFLEINTDVTTSCMRGIGESLRSDILQSNIHFTDAVWVLAGIIRRSVVDPDYSLLNSIDDVVQFGIAFITPLFLRSRILDFLGIVQVFFLGAIGDFLVGLGIPEVIEYSFVSTIARCVCIGL